MLIFGLIDRDQAKFAQLSAVWAAEIRIARVENDPPAGAIDHGEQARIGFARELDLHESEGANPGCFLTQPGHRKRDSSRK